MRFTLRQLEYFVATCDAGSVTEAALRIPVAQSSVSAAIAQLEAALDVQLLIRHHAQGVSPTPAGRKLLERARELLRDADGFERFAAELTEELTGTLQLGCLVTLAPLVAPRLCLVGDAEVALPVRATRLASQAALHQHDGLVASSSLLSEDARVVQRLGMIRDGREDPAVERLGLAELLIPLQQDGDRDRFVERQLAALRVGRERQRIPARGDSAVVRELAGRVHGTTSSGTSERTSSSRARPCTASSKRSTCAVAIRAGA